MLTNTQITSVHCSKYSSHYHFPISEFSFLDHCDTGQIWKESFDCEPMPSSWRFVLPVVCFTFFIILMTYLCEPWILPYFFPTKVQETVALGEFENRDFAPFFPCFLMCFCLWFAVQVVFNLVWIKLILVWKSALSKV